MQTIRIRIFLFLTALVFITCEKKYDVSFQLLWNHQYKKPPEALSLAKTAPFIDSDQLIISPDGILTVLDYSDGSLVWEYGFPKGVYIKSDELILDEQSIYFKDNTNHKIYSFERNSGMVNWINQIPKEVHQFSNDAVDNDNIYLSGDGAEIFRYSKNGNLDKEYDLIVYGLNTDARSIRIFNNQMIFSQRWRFMEDCQDGYCGRILSIDKETEEVLWEYRTDKGGYVFEPILLENGIIYAGVTEGLGEFVALNATNGEVLWKTDGIVSHAYTLTDSMVLVNDGVKLFALDKSTGEILWDTGLAFGGGHGQDNIAYLDGYVYHAHSGSLWILDARTGEIVHRETYSPDGSPFQLLAAGDGKVFVQTFKALYAYTAWK